MKNNLLQYSFADSIKDVIKYREGAILKETKEKILFYLARQYKK